MHSLKNTVVAVLLLGVSYGVYNVLTTPDPALEQEAAMIGQLNIDEGGFASSVYPANVNAPILNSANSISANPNSVNLGNPANNVTNRNHGTSGGGFQATVPPLNASPVASRGNGSGNLHIELPSFSAANIDPRVSVPDGDADRIPETARRQPQHSFGTQKASAEMPTADTNNVNPNDQVLIDAIKDELETDRNIDIFSPGAQPATTGNANSFNPPGGTTRPDTSFISAPPESRDAPLTIELPAETTDSGSEANSSEAAKPLSAMWRPIDKMIEEDNFRGALAALSRYYTDTTLTAGEQEKLMTWLDSLAGKVIYSPEHNLYKNSYTIRDGDTLQDLARRWNVTSQLIFNVNRPNIENPSELPAGAELKMITGPFHAELDLAEGVMTLFVKNLYAGRFNIRVSDASNLQPGSFAIQEKSRDLGGNTWTITLDGGLCIKTVAEGDPVPAGCIGLDPKDSSDVFGILTESSRVFVK